MVQHVCMFCSTNQINDTFSKMYPRTQCVESTCIQHYITFVVICYRSGYLSLKLTILYDISFQCIVMTQLCVRNWCVTTVNKFYVTQSGYISKSIIKHLVGVNECTVRQRLPNHCNSPLHSWLYRTVINISYLTQTFKVIHVTTPSKSTKNIFIFLPNAVKNSARSPQPPGELG